MQTKFVILSSKFLLLCLLWTLSILQVRAINCNSNGNGNWNSAGTWNCGSAPNNGDELMIEANSIVTITENLTYTGEPMKVVVYGVWRFNGGGAKITMPCGSSVVLGFGGQVLGNSSGNSQTIRICNTTYWSSSDGTMSGPMAWPAHALPVDLVAFNARSKDRTVELNWATASEQNSASFELMRSLNTMEWDVVATIDAAGQSMSLQTYTARDAVPVAGDWYYRLQQTDLDGTLHEKGVVPVHVKDERGDLICGPNPVTTGWVDLFWNRGEAQAVELIDMLGNVMQPQVLHKGNGSIRLDMSKASPGQHIITVYDTLGERRSCRVVVQ